MPRFPGRFRPPALEVQCGRLVRDVRSAHRTIQVHRLATDKVIGHRLRPVSLVICKGHCQAGHAVGQQLEGGPVVVALPVARMPLV